MELYAVEKAQQHRRNRQREDLFSAALVIANRIPFHERGVRLDEVLQALEAYTDGNEEAREYLLEDVHEE